MDKTRRGAIIFLIFAVLGLESGFSGAAQQPRASQTSLSSFLPQFLDWKIAEEIQRYNSETLFQYIDGAAEAYIGYDFKELVVGQFKAAQGKATLTAEIYDMGSGRNAFGIYSVERSPESRFLPIGVQGYIEEGSLNFFAGRWYVKLLAFDGGPKTEEILRRFADAILGKIGEKGAFPSLLKAFPGEGLVPNSERFILRNFMGYKFLKNGYMASYTQDGQEFDGFMIEGESVADAESMLNQYRENFRGGSQAVENKPYGSHIRDPYLKNVYIARSGNILCGVAKIKDGQEALGEKYLKALAGNVAK
jgi:hypothetical protein